MIKKNKNKKEIFVRNFSLRNRLKMNSMFLEINFLIKNHIKNKKNENVFKTDLELKSN